jgi:curli production assembly/transport component CsgF
MKKHLLKLFFIMCFSIECRASNLIYEFKDPSFSGNGWSTQVITLEQIESARKQKIKDDQAASIAKAAADAKNSNLSKFLVNVESRIYAQLSKQLADQMFTDSGATSGTMDFQGTSINWIKGATDVSLTITEPNGNTTDIIVPIGQFGF